MGSRWFVFSLHCVTCLPAPSPPPRRGIACMSTQHFTLTRVTGCIDGSDKSLIGVKCCHGFGRAETPGCGCTVTGTGCFFSFFLSSPHAALRFCATAMWGCIMSADLLTQSLHYCVQEAALRAQHFHPTTFRMSRLGRDRTMEGRGRGAEAGGGMMM